MSQPPDHLRARLVIEGLDYADLAALGVEIRATSALYPIGSFATTPEEIYDGDALAFALPPSGKAG